MPLLGTAGSVFCAVCSPSYHTSLISSLRCLFSFKIVFTFCAFIPLFSACSSSAVCSECCHQSPVQSAVVLKAPPCQSSLTQGLTVTVLCKDTLSKRNSCGSERARALKPADNPKARRTLKFSKSLNDVGEKAQDTVESFDYVERTCSEGKLILPQDPGLRVSRFHQKETRALHRKPLGSSKHSCVSSLSANRSTASEVEAGKGGMHVPLLEEKADGEAVSRRRRLLRYLFSLSHGSSASSLHRFHELESCAAHLHTAKSSSGLAGSTGFCSEEMGDDDVFEDSTSAKWKSKVLRAPLCSVEKDSDLDCPSPPSEKCPPISPVSTSGDACRLVCQEPPFWPALLPIPRWPHLALICEVSGKRINGWLVDNCGLRVFSRRMEYWNHLTN